MTVSINRMIRAGLRGYAQFKKCTHTQAKMKTHKSRESSPVVVNCTVVLYCTVRPDQSVHSTHKNFILL